MWMLRVLAFSPFHYQLTYSKSVCAMLARRTCYRLGEQRQCICWPYIVVIVQELVMLLTSCPTFSTLPICADCGDAKVGGQVQHWNVELNVAEFGPGEDDLGARADWGWGPRQEGENGKMFSFPLLFVGGLCVLQIATNGDQKRQNFFIFFSFFFLSFLSSIPSAFLAEFFFLVFGEPDYSGNASIVSLGCRFASLSRWYWSVVAWVCLFLSKQSETWTLGREGRGGGIFWSLLLERME